MCSARQETCAMLSVAAWRLGNTLTHTYVRSVSLTLAHFHQHFMLISL